MTSEKDNVNTFWAELIVEELIRCGVDHFCISPGSRSTPLVVAVARNKKARHCIHYDERGAAFYALGYARAAGKPAAVITTSGTAAANLYPAVTEASVDHVPMILLTADRPPELIDTGANQAMRQDRFFGGFVRWYCDLPTPATDVPPQMVLTTVDQAVYRSRFGDAGPVHLNCRYREPLEPCGCEIPARHTAGLASWTESARPFTSYTYPHNTLSPESIESVTQILANTSRGLVVVGRLEGENERAAVLRLIGRLKWPVYADLTSGLRLTHCATHIIRHFDQELLSSDFNQFVRPSTVLHIGGRTISKRLGEFFQVNRPDHYIVLKPTAERYDPVHTVTMHVQADISAACDVLAHGLQNTADSYADFFSARAADADRIIGRHIAEHPAANEPFVARCISEQIPDGSCLFVSSSMPIRDVDLYGISGRRDIRVAANRGISGIDGVISSAAGFAVGAGRPTTLLIGDLAFIHDINALATLQRQQAPLVIVVINNRGGGIFHFLPISAHADVFEDYFATPHDFSFGGACETFSIAYHRCTEKDDFVQTYRRAAEQPRPCVIEVPTDRSENLRIRRAMKAEIIDMLNASVDPKQ
ncbi:MAG: 2-succinyl-5-enolpyruvyl-6-hydroxy-3-cyclohexene-1-carboxylic-acid synthase [Phycisphaerae bacterium]|nr:2-succinyl-5-enolpyruvyl-6-hydroxy-3-cyclohexene-1-carboxylic-acid synthase [Phycisphaerae bacterium]